MDMKTNSSSINKNMQKNSIYTLLKRFELFKRKALYKYLSLLLLLLKPKNDDACNVILSCVGECVCACVCV